MLEAPSETMVFSQLGFSTCSFAPLVEQVDAGVDRVLVYLKEVRLRTLGILNAYLPAFPVLLFISSVSQVPKGVPLTYNLQLKCGLVVNLKPVVISFTPMPPPHASHV